MRTGPFVALYLVLLVVLLGAELALARWVKAGDEGRSPVEAAAEGVMALPPKPEGLERTADAEGVGDGGEARLTPAACEVMAPSIRDECWKALARQQAPVDPTGALDWCTRLSDPELGLECRADVAETVAPADRVGAEAICAGIDSVKWRGQCHFGIGLALAETDPEYAVGRCQHAEAFRLFCRHDVIGETSLVNLPFAVSFCAREEGEELQRKTCWHGIGKYLARRSLDEAAAACGEATAQWRGNCFHGVGWGAAERDPDAALAGCDRQAPYVDNCRQGVAHELKRADPERAVALCKSIGTASIQARCLDFVTR